MERILRDRILWDYEEYCGMEYHMEREEEIHTRMMINFIMLAKCCISHFCNAKMKSSRLENKGWFEKKSRSKKNSTHILVNNDILKERLEGRGRENGKWKGGGGGVYRLRVSVREYLKVMAFGTGRSKLKVEQVKVYQWK